MQRLPPNQRLTTDFPILHFGRVPEFDPGTWDIRVEGLVENPVRLSYDEILSLKKTESISDFHCEYTTSLPLSELMEPDVLLAYAFNGEPLESAHGGALRLVVPKNMLTSVLNG